MGANDREALTLTVTLILGETMSQQEYPHEKFNFNIRGTMLSARTAKMQHGTGVFGQFNLFYVPHKQSLPCPMTKNGKMAADPFVSTLIARYEGRGACVPLNEMVRSTPATKESIDMRPVPLELICYRMAHTLDIAPINRPAKLSALENTRMEVCGHINAGMRFACRDGVILSLFGKRKLSSDFGAETQSGGTYIRIRSGAAYQKITMRLPSIRGIAYEDCAIEGRFDILSVRDAYGYGIVPLARPLEALYEPVYFREVFDVTEISSATESLPTLVEVKTVTESGEVITVKRARKKRIIGDSAAL